LSLVFCSSTLFGPDGRNLGDIYGGHAPTVAPDAWKALLVTNFIATPSVIASRAQLLALVGVECRLQLGQDQDTWIRLPLVGDVGSEPESLVNVHERENSLSNWNLDEQL